MKPEITVSIVSHGQRAMVLDLLDQLARYTSYIETVIVTHNLAGEEDVISSKYPFELRNLHNESPLGFGSNHNQAFQYSRTRFYCVMNPDLNVESDPFGELLNCLEDPSISIIAPTIVSPQGKLEDSARYFPTPFDLVRKLFSSYSGIFPLEKSKITVFPDWVAGMFLLFPAEKFKELCGFDEKFFLYYEDVDLCARSWRSGYKVVMHTEVFVIHDARRDSHTSFKYLKWHLASAMRFFALHWGRFPMKDI